MPVARVAIPTSLAVVLTLSSKYVTWSFYIKVSPAVGVTRRIAVLAVITRLALACAAETGFSVASDVSSTNYGGAKTATHLRAVKPVVSWFALEARASDDIARLTIGICTAFQTLQPIPLIKTSIVTISCLLAT